MYIQLLYKYVFISPPLCHPLLPLPLHNADEKARSRAPTLQKLSLPSGVPSTSSVPVAFDVYCTIVQSVFSDLATKILRL